MSPGVQAVVALLFVTVLGTVLIQPILDAVEPAEPLPGATEEAEPDPTRSRPADARTATPTPKPSPSAGAFDEVSGPLRTEPLFDRYPSRCLRAATPRADRLVLVNEGLVQTATNFQPDPGQGQIAARSLVGIDVSATTYASYVRPRDVLFAPWQGVAGADGERGPPIRAAAWSPVSSCGLTLTSNGLLRVVPDGAVLVRDGVRDFTFSPDGRSVAVVRRERNGSSIWVAELEGRDLREVHRNEMGSRLRLRAWAPDGDIVYFTANGATALRFVTTERLPKSGGIEKAAHARLGQCSERLLGVVHGSIGEIAPGGPVYVTDRPQGVGYTAASCSPDGRFIAAIRDDSLVLLDNDGNLLRDLTTDGGYRDIDPDWGDSGSGLLFGRVPDGGGRAEVWHIPEGGTARDTGLVYRPGRRTSDWSASPPTGLP